MSECPTQKPTKRLIKEEIRRILKGKTLARDNVVISQSVPTEDEEVPKILIYTTTETVARFNQSPKDYRRELTVAIECLHRGDNDNDLDECLEAMAETVETLMEMDETLNNLVNGLELRGSAYATSEEGSAFMGSLVLTYEVSFFENAIRKNSICYPPLKTAVAEWELGSDSENPASDQYNFEQNEGV